MNKTPALALVSVLLTACFASKPQETGTGVVVETKASAGQIATYSAVGEIKDPVHGREVFMSYGAMAGVGGVIANGVSSVHVFEDGQSNVGIQLNIKGAPDGKFYQAWASRPDLDPVKWVNLGHINSIVGDVRHALKTDQKDDLRSYSTIVITLENDDGDTTPGEVVSEGTLKKANR